MASRKKNTTTNKSNEKQTEQKDEKEKENQREDISALLSPYLNNGEKPSASASRQIAAMPILGKDPMAKKNNEIGGFYCS